MEQIPDESLLRLSAQTLLQMAEFNHCIGVELIVTLLLLAEANRKLEKAYSFMNLTRNHNIFTISRGSACDTLNLLKEKNMLKDEFKDVEFDNLYLELAHIPVSDSKLEEESRDFVNLKIKYVERKGEVIMSRSSLESSKDVDDEGVKKD